VGLIHTITHYQNLNLKEVPDSDNMASSKNTAGMFPHLHLVTPTQRQTIIDGKYINLASLLVPPSDNHDIRQIEADGTVITVKAKDALRTVHQ